MSDHQMHMFQERIQLQPNHNQCIRSLISVHTNYQLNFNHFSVAVRVEDKPYLAHAQLTIAIDTGLGKCKFKFFRSTALCGD